MLHLWYTSFKPQGLLYMLRLKMSSISTRRVLCVVQTYTLVIKPPLLTFQGLLSCANSIVLPMACLLTVYFLPRVWGFVCECQVHRNLAL
jgi:hypothetical protein